MSSVSLNIVEYHWIWLSSVWWILFRHQLTLWQTATFGDPQTIISVSFLHSYLLSVFQLISALRLAKLMMQPIWIWTVLFVSMRRLASMARPAREASATFVLAVAIRSPKAAIRFIIAAALPLSRLKKSWSCSKWGTVSVRSVASADWPTTP